MSQDSLAPAVIYKPIEGFPRYRVGTDGSIWSCAVSRGKMDDSSDQWKQLTISPNPATGYCLAQLRANGKRKSRGVHVLVLEAFRGPCPEGMEGAHGNGIRHDNRMDNLRWDTRKNNHADKWKHGTQPVGEKIHCAKLTEAAVREIREQQGKTRGVDLARKFGVSKNLVSQIQHRKAWRWIPE